MELNKLEKQIREKLNRREIQTSAKAWDRLDAMLSVAEEKKTKRSFGWLYIAASILVFVSVGMYFFNQDKLKINTNETIVVNETEMDSNVTNSTTVTEKENEVSSIDVQSSNHQANNKSLIISNHKSVIAQSDKSFNSVEANQKTNKPSSIINTRGKAERSVAKEKAIEYQNSSDVALKNLPKIMTSDKEIAVVKSFTTNQDELALVDVKKSDNISKVKVNANSLLSEVDGELELTFREKVFKKVDKNYKEVKVALANRNLRQ